MAKGWTKRSNHLGEENSSSHIEALDVNKNTTFAKTEWKLPPSKSHLIRMMHLCALSKEEHTLNRIASLGEDPESMARCLEQLGVKISLEKETLSIQGLGIPDFIRPTAVLDAGNSGTALRLLMSLASRTNFPLCSMEMKVYEIEITKIYLTR